MGMFAFGVDLVSVAHRGKTARLKWSSTALVCVAHSPSLHNRVV